MKALVSRHRRDSKKVSVTGAGQCINFGVGLMFSMFAHTLVLIFTLKKIELAGRLMVQI